MARGQMSEAVVDRRTSTPELMLGTHRSEVAVEAGTPLPYLPGRQRGHRWSHEKMSQLLPRIVHDSSLSCLASTSFSKFGVQHARARTHTNQKVFLLSRRKGGSKGTNEYFTGKGRRRQLSRYLMTMSVESSIREKSALSGSVPKGKHFFLLENLVEKSSLCFHVRASLRETHAHTHSDTRTQPCACTRTLTRSCTRPHACRSISDR